MAQSFMVKIKDEEKRRIVIDKDAWDKEGIGKGDWVKVTIEKT